MTDDHSTTETAGVHKLYRHYSADGELLYIGITARVPDRFAAHSRLSPWWSDVTRIEIATYPTRESVLRAEAEAIQAERPRYNIRHKAEPEPVPEIIPAWRSRLKLRPGMPKPMRVMRPAETAALVGLCDRQLREMEAQGLFPRRFQLNPSGRGRAVGHLESEVDEWITTRSTARP